MVYGGSLASVYWLSQTPLFESQMSEIRDSVAHGAKIYFIAIKNAKSLSSAIGEIRVDVTKYYERDNTKRSLIVTDDLMDSVMHCDAFGSLLATCRHIGVSTITMFQAITQSTRPWDTISNCPLLCFFRMGMGSSKIVTLLNSAVLSRSGGTKNSKWITQVYKDFKC